MYRNVNLFLALVFLVFVPFLIIGCTEPSTPSARRATVTPPLHEVKTVYVRAGQAFIPAPYAAYALTNEPPLDFSTMSPQPIVYYLEPGTPMDFAVWYKPWSLGPVVLMPAPASGQPPSTTPPQPVYMPQPQQPIVVTPPTQHHRMEHMEPREITCPTCGGVGKLLCPVCHGTGGLYCNNCRGTGKITVDGKTYECPQCFATGKVPCNACGSAQLNRNGWIICNRCNGTGKITR